MKRFFNAPDPEGAGYGDAVVFAAACTVASIVGYLVQQFIIGTGIAKVAGKIGEVTKLTGRLTDGIKALKTTVGNAARTAAASARGVLRGASEAINGFLKKIGVNWGDDIAAGVGHCVARFGATNSCDIPWVRFPGARNLPQRVADLGRTSQTGLRPHIARLIDEAANGGTLAARKGAAGHLEWLTRHGDDVAQFEFPHPLFRGKRADYLLDDGMVVELKNLNPFAYGSESLRLRKAAEIAEQYRAFLTYSGRAQVVLIERMGDDFLDALEFAGVPRAAIVNGII